MGSRSFTVVLVESSQLVLEAIADMLREFELVTLVGTTTDLSAALRLAEREQPDLVLVDSRIGGVGATSLIEQFRACSPGSAVAITASRCDVDTESRATQAGALGCFEKDSLLAAVPALLGRLEGPGERTFVVLPLLGIVLVLMVAPAVVVGVSMLDGHLLDRTLSWLDWSGGLTRYVDIGRLGSTLVLAGLVSKARQDA